MSGGGSFFFYDLEREEFNSGKEKGLTPKRNAKTPLGSAFMSILQKTNGLLNICIVYHID